jgi:hypothetical protein
MLVSLHALKRTGGGQMKQKGEGLRAAAEKVRQYHWRLLSSLHGELSGTLRICKDKSKSACNF